MKLLFSTALALALAATGASAWAAKHTEHAGHHPAGAASAPASKVMPGKPGADIARMDTQMQAMRQMHDKMAAAKTPEERKALMAEHHKSMQDGMTMMNGMAPGGMSGMKGEMGLRHQSMEKRMEMMQSMMQMMMDRMPAAVPAK